MRLAYSVIIPAYNEAGSIARAVNETAKVFSAMARPYEIIVVDDGSQDRTAEIVDRLKREHPQLKLLRHAANQGKGAAVKTGVAQAQGEIVMFLDADLAAHPSEIKGFLPFLADHDIVIGSRTARGTRIARPQPLYRVLFGKLFNLLAVRWYLSLPFHDTQCGFKVFKRKTLHLFSELKTGGWVFDVELLARARQASYRIKERPVVWRHGRESKVRLRDVRKILRDIAAVRRALGSREK